MNSTQPSEGHQLPSSYRRKLARLVTVLLIATACVLLTDILIRIIGK